MVKLGQIAALLAQVQHLQQRKAGEGPVIHKPRPSQHPAPSPLLGGILGMSYQVVLAVLGVQHGSYLLQVAAVATLFSTGGEAQRDDPLCDVDQIHLVSLLHGLHHTLAPAGSRVYRVDLLIKTFLKSSKKYCVLLLFHKLAREISLQVLHNYIF